MKRAFTHCVGIIGILRPITRMRPKVVFVLGAPGVGKGTQCSNLVNTYGFTHLSAGDLLRKERSRDGSQYSELIESHIRDGKIVPSEITCSLLLRAMTETGNDKFLIDGFPRNQNNLDGWLKGIADSVELLFVLYFKCSLEMCTNRCLARGAAGSGRSDDNIESIQKRFNTYLCETKPIIDHYQQLNMVREIDGSKPMDSIFDAVRKVFDPIFRNHTEA